MQCTRNAAHAFGLIAFACACTAHGVASAQSAGGDFAITRETIASGGARATGGDYTTVVTTAQPVLGTQGGGDFVVRGGFHVPTPPASVVQDIFADGFES